jgi:hypothetical protein
MNIERKKYCYSYYGLNIKSFFSFPELLEIEFEKPDVVVSLGKVKEGYSQKRIPEGLHFDSMDCFVFKVGGSFMYQVSEGRSIVVEILQDKGSDLECLRLYLLGPVFSALLHQRRITLFHASVVCKNSQCIAIAGKSGSGKSTMAAELCLQRGYFFLADDVCAIAFSEGSYYRILPSTPRIKIFPDAMERLHLGCDNFKLISENTGKFSIPVKDRLPDVNTRLKSFFTLKTYDNNEIGVFELKGIEKVESLLKNSLWVDYFRWMGHQEYLFSECSSICRNVEVYMVNFDKKIHPPGLIADIIENTLIQNLR